MNEDVRKLTAHIVVSYVRSNSVEIGDLPSLIESVFETLRTRGQPPAVEAKVLAKPTAAEIRRSITPQALISFLDGKPYKVLKRHPAQRGITPAAYRETFGLPKDYPFTAPAYSAQRAELARRSGLGRPFSGTPSDEPVSANDDWLKAQEV